MINKIWVFVFALALLLTANVSGQINVYHVNESAGQPAGKGSFYILPQTVLRVDVVVRADEQLKGPYAEYAAKFLGLEAVNNFDFTTYSIENVEVNTAAEPDPGQLYFVEMPSADSKDLRTFKLKVNDSGYLLAANDLNQTMPAEPKKTVEVVEFQNPFDGRDFPEFRISGNVTTKVDTIIRKISVDTIETEQRFYRARLEEKTTEQMAMEALLKIQQIRDSKYNLLTGFQETPYESGTIKFMFDNLNKLENEYLDLFRGKSYSEYYHYSYYYVPDEKSIKNPVELFRFSTGSGVSNSASGESVQIRFTTNGMEQIAGNYPESASGIAYRVPGFSVVEVDLNGDLLYKSRIIINQFGVVKRLPSRKFNAEFNTVTGGLKSLFLEAGDR